MKATVSQAKRFELEAHLAKIGYTKDRFGHWHKTLSGSLKSRNVRFKMGKKSCRYEVAVINMDRRKRWLKRNNHTLFYINFHLVDGLISFTPKERKEFLV